MAEKKKKPRTPVKPRVLGVSVTDGSMGTDPISGLEKGTFTRFSYFTGQDTGIDVKLIQLHPMPPDTMEAMKKKVLDKTQGEEDIDLERFEEFFDSLSWNFSITGYFGRDENHRLNLRTFKIDSKEAAKSFVALALALLKGPSIDEPRVIVKNSEEADEDEPLEEPGYTSVLQVRFIDNENEDGTRSIALQYSLADDNGDTEFFHIPMEASKFQDLMEKIDARLNPDV